MKSINMALRFVKMWWWHLLWYSLFFVTGAAALGCKPGEELVEGYREVPNYLCTNQLPAVTKTLDECKAYCDMFVDCMAFMHPGGSSTNCILPSDDCSSSRSANEGWNIYAKEWTCEPCAAGTSHEAALRQTGQDFHGVYGYEYKGEGVSVSDNGRVIAMSSLQDSVYIGIGQCDGGGYDGGTYVTPDTIAGCAQHCASNAENKGFLYGGTSNFRCYCGTQDPRECTKASDDWHNYLLGSGRVRVFQSCDPRKLEGGISSQFHGFHGCDTARLSSLAAAESYCKGIWGGWNPANAGYNPDLLYLQAYYTTCCEWDATESKCKERDGPLWRQLGADIEGDFGTRAEFPVSLSGDGMEVAIGIVPEPVDTSVSKVRVLRFVETRTGSVDYKETGASQVCDPSDTKNVGFFEGEQIGPFDLSGCASACRHYDGFRYDADYDPNTSYANCVCQYGNVRDCALTSSTWWSQYEILKESWKVVGSDLEGAVGEFTGHDVSLSRDGSVVALGSSQAGSNGAVSVYKTRETFCSQDRVMSMNGVYYGCDGARYSGGSLNSGYCNGLSSVFDGSASAELRERRKYYQTCCVWTKTNQCEAYDNPCPATHPFLGGPLYGDKYWCYVSGPSSGPCNMANSGLPPPPGGAWGTNQPDCTIEYDYAKFDSGTCESHGYESVSADDCETAATALGITWKSNAQIDSPDSNLCVFYEAGTYVQSNSGTAANAKCSTAYECVCRRRAFTTNWLVRSDTCESAGYSDIGTEQVCKSAATALGKSWSEDTATVYVSGGSLSDPYYRFYTDASCSTGEIVESGGIYALKENTLYTFRRCDDATTHPFDVYPEGGSGVTTGITGSTTLSLMIGNAGGRYTWTCTSHSQMTGTFQAARRKCLAKDASTFSWDVTPGSDAVCIRTTPFDWVQLGPAIEMRLDFLVLQIGKKCTNRFAPPGPVSDGYAEFLNPLDQLASTNKVQECANRCWAAGYHYFDLDLDTRCTCGGDDCGTDMTEFTSTSMVFRISKATSSEFGNSVSLSADGTKLAVGARYYGGDTSTDDNYHIGLVSVFEFSRLALKWEETISVTGLLANDEFGYDVSLSSDGSTFAAGARFPENSNIGRVRVFTWDGSVWMPRGTISGIPGDESNEFMRMVGLNEDGSVLAVGAPQNNVGSGNDNGKVILFAWKDDAWQQVGLKLYGGLPQMCLTKIEAFNDVHYNTNLGTTGCAGAKSQIGNFVENYCVGKQITGTYGENIIGQEVWDKYVSTHLDWYTSCCYWDADTSTCEEIHDTQDNPEFGTALHLSADGSTLIVGGPYNDFTTTNAGTVRVFSVTGTCTDCAAGQAQDEARQLSCDVCANGKYSTGVNYVATRMEQDGQCTDGYVANTGQSIAYSVDSCLKYCLQQGGYEYNGKEYYKANTAGSYEFKGFLHGGSSNWCYCGIQDPRTCNRMDNAWHVYAIDANSVPTPTCTDCPAGYSQNLNGQTSQTSCKACEAGMYEDEEGKNNCLMCTPGKFSRGTDNPCPATHPFLGGPSYGNQYWCYVDIDDHSKGICNMANSGLPAPPGGAWGSNQPDCVVTNPCPSSHPYLRKFGATYYYCYSTSTGSSGACRMSNSGISAPSDGQWGASPNVFDCVFYPSPVTTCSDCLPGFYQDQYSAPICNSCPSGWYSRYQGSGMCNEAVPGKYSVGSLYDARCTAGFYQDEAGQTSCKACEAGKYEDEEDSTTECKSCPSGWAVSTSGAATCAESLPGTYATSDGLNFLPCPAGKYEDEYGKPCQSCYKGKYSEETGLTSNDQCKNCPAGFYSDEHDRSNVFQCKMCASGKYGDEIGANEASDCKECATGTYLDEPSFSQVIASGQVCDIPDNGGIPHNGFTLEECAQACLDVGGFTGFTYKSPYNGCYCQSEPIEGCPTKGSSWTQYAFVVVSPCKDCPAGTYQSELGKQSCKDCPSGKFGNEIGASDCKFCTLDGTYVTGEAQVSCLDCPGGYYSASSTADNNWDSCKVCGSGQFQEDSVSAWCTACPAGFVSLNSKCNVNRVSSVNNIQWTGCAGAMWSNGQDVSANYCYNYNYYKDCCNFIYVAGGSWSCAEKYGSPPTITYVGDGSCDGASTDLWLEGSYAASNSYWTDRLPSDHALADPDAAQECANRCVAKYGVKILGIYIRVSDGKCGKCRTVDCSSALQASSSYKGYSVSHAPLSSGAESCSEIDECEANPCQNGATCTDLVNSYSCACQPGYDGFNCENDINECSPGRCKHGGVCTDLVNDYSCACQPGYTGKSCEVNIDECAPAPCQNGATCSDLINDYSCACPAGYSGKDCEIEINECAPRPGETPQLCYSNGGVYFWKNQGKIGCDTARWSNGDWSLSYCTATGDSGTAMSQELKDFFTTCCEWSDDGTCVDTYPVQSSPCQNGASCTDLVNDYSCACPAGYSGKNCEIDIDECAPAPCQNGAACTDLVNDYSCACLPGYIGKDCETDIDECTADTYSVESEKYFCDTPALTSSGGETAESCMAKCNGLTGCEFISFRDATPFHCMTHSTCENKTSSQYTVYKQTGTPCQNGAACTDLVNDYSCACLPGYTGKDCEINIDECAPAPCQNGAACIDLVNGYNCTCLPGWEGKDCETDIDDCAPGPCLNGANCTDKLLDYDCSCVLGFEGKDCEVNIDDCKFVNCGADVCVDGVNTFSCEARVDYVLIMTLSAVVACVLISSYGWWSGG